MKPIFFTGQNITYLLEDYKVGTYKAQVGPLQVSFDFDEDEIYVDIKIWGQYRDYLCKKDGDCKYANTKKCNKAKCRRRKYFTTLIGQLSISEKYEVIAEYFSLPDIEVNPISRMSAIKLFITSLLDNPKKFLYELYKKNDSDLDSFTIPYKAKMDFLRRPWYIDELIIT